MLPRLIVALAILSLALPAAAQVHIVPPAPPATASTQLLCCSGWDVTVRPGWPDEFPDLRPVEGSNLSPSWPVVTLTVVPRAAHGNTYGLFIPGALIDFAVWNPASSFKVHGGRYLDVVTPLKSRRFTLTVPNALGGQFASGGILQVYLASHLPPRFTVTVDEGDGLTRDIARIRR
jgi:hypothetical protein